MSHFNDGINWTNRPNSDDYLAWQDHEHDITQRMLQEKGHIFVDVGAHVGRYSLRLAKNFDIVYAIEPGKKQREGLSMNLDLNPIWNVLICPFAAWDSWGEIDWEENNNAQSHGAWHPHDQWHNGTVKVAPLDDLVGMADLVKIDVEGAEVEVLHGMDRIINESRPEIVIEVHECFRPESPQLCEKVLKYYHYEIEEIPYNVEGLRYWWAA